MKGSDPMTTSIRPGIRPGTYLIDPTRSVVRFRATHMFGLKPVDGTFSIDSGTLVVAEDVERSTVSVELDAGSFATDDERRNSDVRGKRFLHTAAYPRFGFRSTGVAATAGGWQLAGVLSVRGGSGEVVLDLVDAAPAGAGYRFSATTRIDRVAVGAGGGRPIVGRYVDATIEVYAAPVD
jgi:polyisoprenoid-binding protein YceI